MGDLKWLDEYSGETTDELIALEGEYRTDSIVLAFEQAVDQKVSGAGSEEERIVLAIESLEREVNNGGYGQFFVNYSREYASIVVNALNRIGCSETATLTQNAINILGIQGPLTVEAIDRVMQEEDDERDAKLDACDNQYFQVAGDLAEPLLEFIKNNRNKIRLTD